MEETEIERNLERARAGDSSAVGALLEGHRARLERLVALRLDRRLRGRMDAADVLQDVFLEAMRRLPDYLQRPPMPFYIWLRFIAFQRLQELCRTHLGRQKRDARRETPLDVRSFPEATSEALAAQLVGKLTTPPQAAVRAEMTAWLGSALESMAPGLREVIVLRHFEDLTNAEAAHVLGLQESTASKRYIRALKQLRETLDRVSGMSEATWK